MGEISLPQWLCILYIDLPQWLCILKNQFATMVVYFRILFPIFEEQKKATISFAEK